MSPIHTTIFCHPWQYPSHLPRLADEAEQDMRAAGATNIRHMQYRMRRDVTVDGYVYPFGVQFYAQADKVS